MSGEHLDAGRARGGEGWRQGDQLEDWRSQFREKDCGSAYGGNGGGHEHGQIPVVLKIEVAEHAGSWMFLLQGRTTKRMPGLGA